ncbi:hypothetical protein COCON_G00106490 [Conger conger]|uniref:TSG101 and ALIX binding domain-containing protein n=1 Tax=Conger conger TaxID=82655 RepID=A0A9Q1DIQ4_CONCO|nr:hypothetical protein COCON_G00106490 [Conger conger]
MEKIKAEKVAVNSKLPSSYRLNTSYQWTGHEMDDTIADLEARLGRYDGTCMKVDTEESFALKPSKSLLGLCNEASNINQSLPDSPTETHGVHKSKTNKLEFDCRLHHAWETEHEISGIADRQLLLKEFRKQTTEGQWTMKDEQDLFCSSLDEVSPNQLAAQLGAMITVCQDLLKRLERKRQGDESMEKGTHELPFKQSTDYSKAAHLNTLVSKLREENKELKQRIAIVENLNSEWQKYDQGREEYVKGLCKRLKESDPLAGVGVALRAGVGTEALVQQEIARLNCLLDEKMKDCTKLRRELEDSRKEYQEHIQALKQQALIYEEDFKCERADRERAQSKIQDLQQEVLRLQLKLRKKQERGDASAMCWVHLGHRMSAHIQVDGAEPLMTSADQPGLQQSSRQLATVQNNSQGLMDLQCP